MLASHCCRWSFRRVLPFLGSLYWLPHNDDLHCQSSGGLTAGLLPSTCQAAVACMTRCRYLLGTQGGSTALESCNVRWHLFAPDLTAPFRGCCTALPQVISDHLWYAGGHPNANARRCLPCHFKDMDRIKLVRFRQQDGMSSGGQTRWRWHCPPLCTILQRVGLQRVLLRPGVLLPLHICMCMPDSLVAGHSPCTTLPSVCPLRLCRARTHRLWRFACPPPPPPRPCDDLCGIV